MTKPKSNLYLAIAIIVPIISSLSSLLNTFGFLDDYVFLLNVKSDKNALINLLISAGRPLNAWAYDLSFTLAGTVENLVALRFLSVALLSVFSGLLFVILKNSGLPNNVALVISGVIGSSSSFSVFASWAQHWTTSFTLALVAFCAYWMNQSFSKRTTAIKLVIVTILLTLAAVIYVPAALLFPIFITLRYVLNKTEFKLFFIEVIWASSVILITAFIALQIGQHIFPSDAARFQLSGDAIMKTLWFVRFPVFQALTPWSVVPQVIDAFLLAVALAALVYFWKKKRLNSDLKNCLAVAICAVIVSSPNLLTSENWASYRSTVALNSLVVIFGVIAIWRVFVRHQEGLGSALGKKIQIVGVPLVIFLAVTKGVITTGAIALPNSFEYGSLVQVTKSQKVDCAVIQTSSWTDSKIRPQAYDEFGIYSGSVPIVAKSMTALALDLDLSEVLTKEEYLRGGDVCKPKIEIDFKNLMERR